MKPQLAGYASSAAAARLHHAPRIKLCTRTWPLAGMQARRLSGQRRAATARRHSRRNRRRHPPCWRRRAAGRTHERSARAAEAPKLLGRLGR
jgi:hypothetical protein